MVGIGRDAGAGDTSLNDTMSIEEDILNCLSGVTAGKSLAPQDIAKTIGQDNWRSVFPTIKKAALGMARKEQIEILRKGKPVDPNEPIKGVIRYRLKP